MSPIAPISPVYKKQTGEAVREFLIANKREIDKTVSDKLRNVLHAFELRHEAANGTNDKENKALRAMGVNLNTMVLGTMLLYSLPQEQEKNLPIHIRELSDEAIEIGNKLGVGFNNTGMGFAHGVEDTDTN